MKKLLLLGNGASRGTEWARAFIRNWGHELWACNRAYKEWGDFPRLDRWASVHKEIVVEAVEWREKFGLSYDIYTIHDMGKYKKEVVIFKKPMGWSTGSNMLQQALLEGYDVSLCGFDMGGAHMHLDKILYGGNFKLQFQSISKRFGLDRIHLIYPTKEEAESKLDETLKFYYK